MEISGSVASPSRTKTRPSGITNPASSNRRPDDIDEAIGAPNRLRAWRRPPVADRRSMVGVSETAEASARELARIVTLENGKDDSRIARRSGLGAGRGTYHRNRRRRSMATPGRAPLCDITTWCSINAWRVRRDIPWNFPMNVNAADRRPLLTGNPGSSRRRSRVVRRVMAAVRACRPSERRLQLCQRLGHRRHRSSMTLGACDLVHARQRSAGRSM